MFVSYPALFLTGLVTAAPPVYNCLDVTISHENGTLIVNSSCVIYVYKSVSNYASTIGLLHQSILMGILCKEQ